MSSQSPARYLAPVALVAAALAILIVWNSSLGDESPQAGSQPAGQTTPSTPSTTSTGETDTGGSGETGGEDGGSGQEATYTVQSGDNLSAISEETGVSVERILELNEGVDPQGLQAGDELTIRP